MFEHVETTTMPLFKENPRDNAVVSKYSYIAKILTESVLEM